MSRDSILAFLHATNQTPILTSPHCDRIIDELIAFEQEYPGGIVSYHQKGLSLFQKDADGTSANPTKDNNIEKRSETFLSPVDGITSMQVPKLLFHAPSLCTTLSPELKELESTQLQLLSKTVFVIVAGGLGERLGFSGIKLSLPIETATSCVRQHQLSQKEQEQGFDCVDAFPKNYLEHYLSFALQCGGKDVPVILMTSEDNDHATKELLRDAVGKVGLSSTAVQCVKQGTVPCFDDGHGVLSIDSEKGHLIRKPHGHGDVHLLLHTATTPSSSSLLLPSLLARGYEYIVFLQDTNAAATTTIPISLAISHQNALDMNFTCVPRRPQEAIGLLCDVTMRDGSKRTQNIEYNEYETLSKKLGGEGDVAALESDGITRGAFSPFPGSINTLILRLETYVNVVQTTKGVVPEFINPKYAPGSKTVFKSPARIESLMQDVALMLNGSQHRVGGTVFEDGLYHSLKNSFEEGSKKYVSSGVEAHTACTAEAAIYSTFRRRLWHALHSIGSLSHEAMESLLSKGKAPSIFVGGPSNTLPVPLAPVVVMHPAVSSGTSFTAMQSALASWIPQGVEFIIDPRSALFLCQSTPFVSASNITTPQQQSSSTNNTVVTVKGIVLWDLSKSFFEGGMTQLTSSDASTAVMLEAVPLLNCTEGMEEKDWMRRFRWTVAPLLEDHSTASNKL